MNFQEWLMGAKPKQYQSGQAIIVIALTMIGLIAIMGLAIDGGGLLLLKRDSQNAVDAAVMAASYARCTGGDVVAAGLAAAADNGFENDATTTVIVRTPPQTGPAAGKSKYVEVIITREKPKYFIQIVYQDPLEVTARGVGYCKPGANMYAGKALFATSKTCQNAGKLGGSSVHIEGGVYSNNQFQTQGSDHYIQGDVEAYGQVSGNNLTVDPDLNNPTVTTEQEDDFPLLYNIADFAPGGATANSIPVADYHAYSGNQTFNGMIEGLIYVNGDVKLNGASANPSKGVTIVATGNIDIVNNVKNQEFFYYIPKLLFFTTANATNCGTSTGMSLAGSSNDMNGLIYAPFASVSLSGSEHELVGAIIAETFELSASDTVIIYDPTVLPPMPPEIVNAE